MLHFTFILYFGMQRFEAGVNVRKKHNEALKMHDFTFIIRLNMVWVISLESLISISDKSLVSYLEFGEWVHVWRRRVQSWEREAKLIPNMTCFFFLLIWTTMIKPMLKTSTPRPGWWNQPTSKRENGSKLKWLQSPSMRIHRCGRPK